MRKRTRTPLRGDGADTTWGLLLSWVLVLAGLLLICLPRTAFALPPPDVVINIVSGLGQTLAVLGAVLGGLLLRVRRGGGRRVLDRLLFGLVCLGFVVSLGVNYFQWRDAEVRRRIRLTRNLLRDSRQEGRVVRDTSLKTLPLSRQWRHPLGVSPERLQALLASGRAPLLVDVRETEEYETGRIPGAVHVRYPDLRADPSFLRGRKEPPILLCYSGNRSSELAEEFSRRGIPCRFLVGGYANWLKEGRPLAHRRGAGGRVRDLLPFPNKDRLLDTPEVYAAMARGDVVFLDVRYPKEFAWEHLRGAVNIPVRKLTTPELEARLNALDPAKRYILVGYDRRSCFYALILAAKLTRRGFTYLGLYTVPHEFLEQDAAAAVAAARHRWTDALRRPLEGLLALGRRLTGNWGLAIVFLVVVLRLLLFPLTLWADVMERRLRRLTPEREALQRRWGGEKDRLHAETVRLYRRHGVRPAVTVLSGLLQVGLFLLVFYVINTSRRLFGAFFVPGWLENLAHPDPYLVLPLLTGVLVVGLVLAGRRSRSGLRPWLAAAAGILFFGLTVPLRAAVVLYLVVNLAWALGQKAALRLGAAARERRRRGLPLLRLRPSPRPILPLRAAAGHPGAGAKAERLARCLRLGFRVPPGFVLMPGFFARHPDPVAPAARRELHRAFDRLGAARVSVRSAALAEDGAERSFAGIFETRLNVTREALPEAVAAVARSFAGERAAHYAAEGHGGACVLVQAMVDAEYAGVLFTRHPRYPSRVGVELVAGLGEALVSGRAAPRSYAYGRLSGRLLEGPDGTPPMDLRPLVRAALVLEEVFGRPQDVEWAYAGGRFHLLQTRDITRLEKPDPVEAEKLRLLRRAAGPDRPVWVLNEMSEDLPFPTAVSLSLLRRLYAPGNAVARSFARLGLPYSRRLDPDLYIETIFGALYVNRTVETRAFHRGRLRASLYGLRTFFRWQRERSLLERAFYEDFLPRFLERVEEEESLNLAALREGSLIRLVLRWVEEFSREIYELPAVVNLVAKMNLDAVGRRLQGTGLSPADFAALEPDEPRRHPADEPIRRVQEGQATAAAYLAAFGFRAPVDFELAEPRFREDPELVRAMLASGGLRGGERPRGLRPEAKDFLGAMRPRRREAFLRDVHHMNRSERLKERAKHHVLRWLALVRKGLLALGERTGLGEDVFHLRLEEIARLRTDLRLAEAARLAAVRRRRREAFRELRLPPEVRPVDVEVFVRGTPAPAAAGVLRGLPVCGDRPVEGRARLVLSREDFRRFRPGEILVTRFTETSHTVLFQTAAGLVTEVGGMLSHAAIVAREMGLPAVVGVAGVTQAVRTGDLVVLHPDGTVERKAREARRAERLPLVLPAEVALNGDLLRGVTENVSSVGALVALEERPRGGELRRDVPVEVAFRNGGNGEVLRVAARVRRVERPGGDGGRRYRVAVEFAEPRPELVAVS